MIWGLLSLLGLVVWLTINILFTWSDYRKVRAEGGVSRYFWLFGLATGCSIGGFIAALIHTVSLWII